MRGSPIALVLGLFAIAACGDDDAPPSPEPPTAEPPPAAHRPEHALHLPETRIDWIAIGGGAEPTSSQVSLEQDLALAREALGRTRGVVLHAGGRGAASVMELSDADVAADALVRRLGELFDPRESRAATYRESAVEPDGPSTREALDAALTLALLAPDGSPPLVLYLSGHGEGGETPSESVVQLWGGFPLVAEDLALRLDDAARPTRVVVTACYSGGFDALAFRAGDPTEGAAPGDRCGLFATMFDRLASGCDPDPDRGTHEGYALHFLHALRGEGPDGRPLAAADVDFDADGRISLAEAHARARIASRSIDVPTTTSERWLREMAPEDAAAAPAADWPIEREVVRRLSSDLGAADAEAARARLAALDTDFAASTERLDEARDASDEAWAKLRILLLERWPILDDPFDPRFAPTVQRDRADIERLLDESAEAATWAGAEANVEALTEAVDLLDASLARITRLVRAHENLELAGRFHRRGGPELAVLEKLLACEGTEIADAPARARAQR